MPIDLTETLVIGISSRSLFDIEEENRIFEEKMLEVCRALIFFNDQERHVNPVLRTITSDRVPTNLVEFQETRK